MENKHCPSLSFEASPNKRREQDKLGGGATLQFMSSTSPLQGYVLVVGVVWMHFESGRTDRQTGYLRKKVCRLCPTYALGICGWLYQFGTDLTDAVNLDDTSTSVVIRDLEKTS